MHLSVPNTFLLLRKDLLRKDFLIIFTGKSDSDSVFILWLPFSEKSGLDSFDEIKFTISFSSLVHLSVPNTFLLLRKGLLRKDLLLIFKETSDSDSLFVLWLPFSEQPGLDFLDEINTTISFLFLVLLSFLFNLSLVL